MNEHQLLDGEHEESFFLFSVTEKNSWELGNSHDGKLSYVTDMWQPMRGGSTGEGEFNPPKKIVVGEKR